MNVMRINTRIIYTLLLVIGMCSSDLLASFETNSITLETNWDGSDIVIEAEQLGAVVQFTIMNIGEDMDGVRSFEVIEDDVIVMVGNYNLNASNGNNAVVTFPASEGEFICKAMLHVDSPFGTYAEAKIEIVPELIGNNRVQTHLDNFENDAFDGNDPTNSISTIVSPNPFNDELHFDLKELGDSQFTETLYLRIYNAYGQLVITKITDESSVYLDNLDLRSGHYFYQILDGESIVDTGKLTRH